MKKKRDSGWGVPPPDPFAAQGYAREQAGSGFPLYSSHGLPCCGVPLQSVTRTSFQWKLVTFTAIALVICATACTNQHVLEKPIDEFVLGTWLVDSTNRTLGKDEHPRIQFLEFLPGKKGISHFFSIRHNKVYVNEVEYSLTDSSFNYDDELGKSGPISAGYRVERLDDDHFRLVAKFPTSNWSDPERDSVIWYSRVVSAEAYLQPIMESGKASEVDCPTPTMALIHGYWKMDSTEYINRTSSEKHYYFFIDTSGTMYTLWLGRKPHRQSNPIKIGRSALIGDDGDSIPIKCLDNERMVFEMPERKGSYEAVFFSRIDPDTIIPDSLRFDRVKLPTKARP